MRILVVEDHDSVACPLQVVLEQQGYEVVRARTGAQALAACECQHFDLILLDLILPDTHGSKLLPKLRAVTASPVIVITCEQDESSCIRMLRAGVDDFIVKPLSMGPLLARIVAVLRRTRREDDPSNAPMDFGDVRIDPRLRIVTVAGKPVALTRLEFDVLLVLARARGAVVERQHILVMVWQTEWLGMSRTLEVHVATLRAKLGRPGLIVTVRGIGYRLAVPPPPPPA
jgi:DNA-binding response OmpR family regulator